MPKKNPYDQEINDVINFLCNRNVRLTLKKISDDTGVPTSWLSMFSRGEIIEPGYVRFATLRDYLANLNI